MLAADLTDGFDAVLHAGDLVHADVLDALAEIAPVHAVLGNNDLGGHVQHHLNPGSAMQRRRQPGCTVAVLELGPDVVDVDIVGV